mmetsp:Transcript_56613/g.131995  ORF Transcript_56613/g.131995 Transcript_56613/m.131995 type:complete len:139 (+) Transcript_56613:2281-2697(+)
MANPWVSSGLDQQRRLSTCCPPHNGRVQVTVCAQASVPRVPERQSADAEPAAAAQRQLLQHNTDWKGYLARPGQIGVSAETSLDQRPGQPPQRTGELAFDLEVVRHCVVGVTSTAAPRASAHRREKKVRTGPSHEPSM